MEVSKMNGINRVVDILMRRDRMSRDEAEDLVNYVRELCEEAIQGGDFFEVDDILADELGLEPDYIFDILNI